MADPITVTIKNLNGPISSVKVQNKLAESAVTSVAGRVGDVTLTQADVAGLENVNNTSDLNKPISTATQAALDLKSNIGHTHAFGDVSGLGTAAAADTGDFAAASHDHSLADITDAGSAAAADTGDFATASHTHLLGDITDAGTAAGSDTGDFAPYVHTHIMSDVTDLFTGAISLTNKTLTDVSNTIHADQLHYRVKADENILKGQPVKYDSFNVGENAINVSLADHMLNVSIGLAEEDIPQGSFGNIITAGVLDHVDTRDFTEGEILYVNSQGLLTGVEPASGYSQPIALCLKSQRNNGALQVLADYPKQPSTDVRNDSTVSGSSVTDALNNLYSSIGGDSAVQVEDINTLTGLNSIITDATLLSSGQISSAYQPLNSVLTNTTASFTTFDELKLDSIASGAEVNVNADWNSVGGDSEILNKPTFGDITGSSTGDFAQASHSHVVADITDLDTGIFSLTGHTHVVSDITDLDTGIFSTTGHDHTVSDIIDAGTMISANTGDYQLVSEKGVANGYASLDGGGKVPAGQLPSYVDDVLEYPNFASLPVTGEFGKIYVTLDNGKIYRWTGTIYVEISSDAGAPVLSVNSLTGIVVLDPDDLDDSATTNKFTTQAEIDKLASIISGAEANVNADWNATSGDTEILNKPALGTMAIEDTGDYSQTGHQHVLADITNAGTMAAADTGDYSPTGHTHNTSDIIGLGTIATFGSGDYSQTGHQHFLSDIFDAGTSASYDVANVGDAADDEVVKGDDSRLDWSDVLGTSAYLDVNPTGDALSFEVVKGSDTRLSTNLSYITGATTGIITSSNGTHAVISGASSLSAGLFSSSDFDKLGLITVTQSVDLDIIEAASGDMLESIYDPSGVSGDAFDMDNMVEGDNTKILTSGERDKLSNIESGADQTTNANVTSSLYSGLYAISPNPTGTATLFIRGGGSIYLSTINGIVSPSRVEGVGAQMTYEKNQPFGYAGLSSSSKISAAALPDIAALSGDNISLFINDSNYAASGENVSQFNNDAGYITSADTFKFSYREETGNYTAVATDYTINCISGNQTITMLDATTVSGQIFVVKNSSTGVITITGTSSQTFDGNASVETNYPQSLTLQSTNTNWIII